MKVGFGVVYAVIWSYKILIWAELRREYLKRPVLPIDLVPVLGKLVLFGTIKSMYYIKYVTLTHKHNQTIPTFGQMKFEERPRISYLKKRHLGSRLG